MDMGELAEPWNTAAERAGVRTTFRGIGDAAGLSHVTVRRLIAEGRTSGKTITKVAEALRVTEDTVREWANVPTSQWGAWTPPEDAHLMSPRARAAVEEMIRVIVEGESDAGTTREKIAGPGELGTVHHLRAARTMKDDPVGKREREWSQLGEESQHRDGLGEESQDDGGTEPS